MAKKNSEVSGWVGWLYFAGTMLLLAGVFQAIAGFVALFKDEVYVVGEQNLWVLDYTTWGWVHLLFGIFLMFAAAAIFSGKLWGRVVGCLVSGLSLIVNFAFIPVYPVWSILMVVLNVFVLYALIVHGDEAQDV